MILIYGATGTTGALCARSLLERGHSVVLSGRDEQRLRRLAERLAKDDLHADIRPARVHATDELNRAMSGADIVISCAGPFLVVGETVLRAAIDAGAHYLDTTGEQGFARAAYELCDSRARKAGVVAVPSFAFEVAVGDWAGALAASRVRELAGVAPSDPIDELTICYAVAGFRPTAGTQQSAVAALGEPVCVWSEDRWEPSGLAAKTRSVRFPEPFGEREALLFPSGEVITLPRHQQVRRVETYLTLGQTSPVTRVATRVAGVLGPLLPALASSQLGSLVRAGLAGMPAPGASEQQEATYAIVAEATDRFHRSRVAISGRNLYRTSAEIIALGVEQLLAGPPADCGVLAPSQLLAPPAPLDRLAAAGILSVEYS